MIFLTGGARSGKSTLAVEMAGESGSHVRYVATALASDEEMKQRIAAHRQSRPGEWSVVEAPIALAEAVSNAEPDEYLIVDCVTLWVSNLMADHDDETITGMVDAVAAILSDRRDAVVVSNEVGSGIVPMDPVGRRFRDLHGRANQKLAAAADRSYLVVAGKTLELGTPGAG